MTERVTFTAHRRRAKNRLQEHHLKLLRHGQCKGQPAVLTACTDDGCNWSGWFTTAEMTIRQER